MNFNPSTAASANKAGTLFSYQKYWAECYGTAPYLPMSREEMDALGWDSCDIIIVTGDAYVDHPSFGMAVIGRFLEAQGFRVGIIAQPRWQNPEDFMTLGKPNLFFGITSGNMDSMINRYTADLRMRSDDAYTPNDEGGKRPDRAVIVYSQKCREAYKDVPLVIGGIEASLRRIAQYDYWSDKIRKSVLIDSGADILLFGNAERAMAEVAHGIANGHSVKDMRDIRGTTVITDSVPNGWTEINSTRIDWPSKIEQMANPYEYAKNQKATDKGSAEKKQAAKLGWVFGLGFFGVGVSWVYVSINLYGNASGLFAAFLTLFFVGTLALLFALQCWVYRRYFSGLQRALGFAACWVLFEWLRSWLLTGFPWLYLGYGHINTLLGNLAPVLGVLGVSFAVALVSGMLYEMFLIWRKEKLLLSKQLIKYEITFILLGLTLFYLGSLSWVEEDANRSVEVALVQANIDQNLKFNPAFIGEGLNLYNGLSAPLWENDIVIWPETAIPLLYQSAGAELAYFERLANENNSSLITGILYREENSIYNSVTSLGNGSGVYHKQKLVPFGEYVPFANIMKTILKIFSLPMSSLSAGPANQALLQASGFSFASYICYEVVYPDFVRKQAHEADFLVTISNDTWFGASFGPLQHLQMAAMRALENGRYMIRATSNGVTAFINEKGQVVGQAKQFEIATLQNTVPAFRGRTPFSYWGSWPIVLFSLLILAAIYLLKRMLKHQGDVSSHV